MKQLYFVHNANSSLIAQTINYWKRTFFPNSVSCNLCLLISKGMAVNPLWKKFVAELPYDVEFFHKDEWKRNYPQYEDMELPAVFLGENGTFSLAINAAELKEQKNMEELQHFIRERLKININ